MHRNALILRESAGSLVGAGGRLERGFPRPSVQGGDKTRGQKCFLYLVLEHGGGRYTRRIEGRGAKRFLMGVGAGSKAPGSDRMQCQSGVPEIFRVSFLPLL